MRSILGRVVAGSAGLWCVVMVAACEQAPVEHEVVRSPGLGGRVELLIIEASAGATTSYSYDVHLVAAGDDPAEAVMSINGATRSGKAYGVDAVWTSADHVQVTYWRADSPPPEPAAKHVTVAGHAITVTVLAGKVNRSAPPGSMHHARGTTSAPR